MKRLDVCPHVHGDIKLEWTVPQSLGAPGLKIRDQYLVGGKVRASLVSNGGNPVRETGLEA